MFLSFPFTSLHRDRSSPPPPSSNPTCASLSPRLNRETRRPLLLLPFPIPSLLTQTRGPRRRRRRRWDSQISNQRSLCRTRGEATSKADGGGGQGEGDRVSRLSLSLRVLQSSIHCCLPPFHPLFLKRDGIRQLPPLRFPPGRLRPSFLMPNIPYTPFGESSPVQSQDCPQGDGDARRSTHSPSHWGNPSSSGEEGGASPAAEYKCVTPFLLLLPGNYVLRREEEEEEGVGRSFPSREAAAAEAAVAAPALITR